MTRPKIAIPVPHSYRPEYAQRSLPQYVHAVEAAGGEAVVIQLGQPSEAIAKQATACQGVLLPGSSADVDPQKYGAERNPLTNPCDKLRDAVDELLLQDAHNMHKPILAICYGMQSLNVWRTGSLVQDIPSQVKTTVNHSAGREVAQAHTVAVDPVSNLASILAKSSCEQIAVAPELKPISVAVNSSHHQAIERAGDGLRVVARCPDDNVIEAVEGTQPGHFLIGVQWHPERGIDDDAPSQALLNSFVEAAAKYRVPKPR
jgi:putative glutamine amidotransferase